MTEFEKLKNSYISTIQIGLTANAGYHQTKHGNDILHKFCEQLVDSSNFQDDIKASMKHELELLKETLSKEIDCYYKKA